MKKFLVRRWRALAVVFAAIGIVVGGVGIASAANLIAPKSAADVAPASNLYGCVASGRTLNTVYTNATNFPGCTGGAFPITVASGVNGTNGTNADAMESSVIQVTNHPDSGNHGNWANDSFARTITVIRHEAVDAAHCGGTPTCFFFTGTLSDSGTFKTITGANSPNAGTPISGTVTGSFTGGSSFQFYSDNSNLQVSSLSNVSGGPSSSDNSWPASFLPNGAKIVGYNLLNWSWTYGASSTCETWTDGINGETGDIVGMNACTS